MANSNTKESISSGNNTTTHASDQELVSILKKSGNTNKRLAKAVRERVTNGGESSPIETEQMLTNSTDGVAIKPEVSRDVAPGPTTTTTPTSTTKSTITTKPPKKAQKPRRRVATLAQRRAANIRERRRMFNLNAAFDKLRKRVPSFAYEKRLSRIETLKLAIMYIRFMDNLVNDDEYVEKYKKLTADSSSSMGMTSSFLTSGSYLSLYGPCGNGVALRRELSPCPASPVPLCAQTSDINQRTGAPVNAMTSIECLKQRCQNYQGISESNIFRSMADSNLVTDICHQQPIAYCTDTNCPSQQQQQQPQHGQQYRALPLVPASPPSCGSIACSSSPNSSSATTCHSVSSSILTESPTSRSPTSITPAQQSGLADQTRSTLNETQSYYPTNQEYSSPTYSLQDLQHQASVVPTSNPCEHPINFMSNYYTNQPTELNVLRKSQIGDYQYQQSASQSLEPLSRNHESQHLSSQEYEREQYRRQQQQQLVNSGRQNHHERLEQQSIYTLHSLEAI